MMHLSFDKINAYHPKLACEWIFIQNYKAMMLSRRQTVLQNKTACMDILSKTHELGGRRELMKGNVHRSMLCCPTPVKPVPAITA